MTATPEESGHTAVFSQTLAEAVGYSRRSNPSLPRTGGPAGNARLTAWTGLLLLPLSVAVLVTLLDVSGLIGWHIFLGTSLVPPALLKTASTSWRIIRYYTGKAEYVQAGPPPMPLRILGPLVVLTTLGVLASGLALVLVGPEDSRSDLFSVAGYRFDAVMIHRVVFLLWIGATGMHVLGRFIPALRLTLAPDRQQPTPDGRGTRASVVVGALLAGLALAWVVLVLSSSWVSAPHMYG